MPREDHDDLHGRPEAKPSTPPADARARRYIEQARESELRMIEAEARARQAEQLAEAAERRTEAHRAEVERLASANLALRSEVSAARQAGYEEGRRVEREDVVAWLEGDAVPRDPKPVHMLVAIIRRLKNGDHVLAPASTPKGPELGVDKPVRYPWHMAHPTRGDRYPLCGAGGPGLNITRVRSYVLCKRCIKLMPEPTEAAPKGGTPGGYLDGYHACQTKVREVWERWRRGEAGDPEVHDVLASIAFDGHVPRPTVLTFHGETGEDEVERDMTWAPLEYFTDADRTTFCPAPTPEAPP